MAALIEVSHVTKVYGRGEAATRALNDVSVDVWPGDVLFLAGPSGSGKTTLLSIMGCILRPTSGSVTVMGTEVTDLRERDLPSVRRERIGFVFQAFNLFPTLTVRQNVTLALDVKGVDRRTARQQASELLALVGLAEKQEQYPANLSGGQKQRVAIARALAGAPRILLADEPTGSLDSENGHAVMSLFAELARDRQCAVVIVTHDVRMFRYANRILRLEDGRIVSDERVMPVEQAGDSVVAPSGRAVA